MPLLAAAATATLAQDRLLKTTPLTPIQAPVAVCDGSLLHKESTNELKCAATKGKAGFAQFNDWTPAVFSPAHWTMSGIWPERLPDSVITSTGTTVECKEVCEKSPCDLDADWAGLVAAVKQELNVDLDLDGVKADNLKALNEILAALAQAKDLTMLTKWLQLNWAAALWHVIRKDNGWWTDEFGTGSTLTDTKLGPDAKKGLIEVLDVVKSQVPALGLNIVKTKVVEKLLAGLKWSAENGDVTVNDVLWVVQGIATFLQDYVESFLKKQMCP